VTGTSAPDPIPPFVLLGMTVVTGIVDAVSFLALGHVFTANMTGNVVFLGFAASGAPGVSIVRSGIALIAFLLGAAAGGRMALEMTSHPAHRWTSRALGLDAAFLLAAAGAALGLPGSAGEDSAPLFAVIALTGVAMGLRNATVRRLAIADLTTTVLTLTITGLAADSSLAGGANPRWRRRLASILCMFAGAAAGGLMLRHSAALPLLVCGIASAAAALTVGVRPRFPGSRPLETMPVHEADRRPV
jgi:uncharacterized membrane protein YoaK (UPF0700 family)